LPPEDRWWGNPWVALVAGVVGALLGVVIGLAVSDNGKTVTETQRSSPTQTVTKSTTVTQPKVETKTVTTTTSTPTPLAAENEARRREAEKNLKTVEKENEELKRQLEGRGTP
jgi:hypothetical protein